MNSENKMNVEEIKKNKARFNSANVVVLPEKKTDEVKNETPKKSKSKIMRIIWLALGCLSLVFVGIGAVVPMLPYFPFLMLSTFCFAKSSERLHNWIINTKLYKKNLESFVKGKGMTKGAKIRIMTTVTIVMAIGFVIMFIKKIYIPCYILAGVWVMHIIIFLFFIKNYVPEKTDDAVPTNDSVKK